MIQDNIDINPLCQIVFSLGHGIKAMSRDEEAANDIFVANTRFQGVFGLG